MSQMRIIARRQRMYENPTFSSVHHFLIQALASTADVAQICCFALVAWQQINPPPTFQQVPCSDSNNGSLNQSFSTTGDELLSGSELFTSPPRPAPAQSTLSQSTPSQPALSPTLATSTPITTPHEIVDGSHIFNGQDNAQFNVIPMGREDQPLKPDSACNGEQVLKPAYFVILPSDEKSRNPHFALTETYYPARKTCISEKQADDLQ